MLSRGAIISTIINRSKRSATIAIISITQTDRLLFFLSNEIVKPANNNSNIITGNMGGAIGGIPVNIQETVGDMIANNNTKKPAPGQENEKTEGRVLLKH